MKKTIELTAHTATHANRKGYTDVDPYEIVRVVSNQTLEIRAMQAERDPTWKPETVPGGFACHTVNNRSQRWIITSDPDAPVIRIRLSKRRGRGWRDARGNEYGLDTKARKFYDYNF